MIDVNKSYMKHQGIGVVYLNFYFPSKAQFFALQIDFIHSFKQDNNQIICSNNHDHCKSCKVKFPFQNICICFCIDYFLVTWNCAIIDSLSLGHNMWFNLFQSLTLRVISCNTQFFNECIGPINEKS